MSGILGLVHIDAQSVEEAHVRPMADTLRNRGGDGEGLWTSGAVGIGNVARNVTPESLFEDPLAHSRDGKKVLTGDIRLDNREELIRTLEVHPQRRRPTTDSEVLLAAYERWGTKCTDHLLGAFAFALWDSQEQRLFLARDHFGVKPLYYAHVPGRAFAFASAASTLLGVEGVSGALDELEVAVHLLVPVEDDATRTIYQDVRALSPAHSLVLQGGIIRVEEYWALDVENEIALSSDEEYAEAFREIFEEAVRCRLRSVKPIGAMLSGGLDSSSIASVASELLDGDLRTYSAVFPETPESDESEYIEAVVARYGFPSHLFRASDESPLSRLEQSLRDVDGPVAAGNLYLNWHLYQTAADQGVGVVLDGFDGDTTVSHGMGYFNELRTRGQLLKLSREVKAYATAIGEPWRPAVWSWLRGPVLKRTGIRHVRRGVLAARRLYRTGSAISIPKPSPWMQLMNGDYHNRIQNNIVAKNPKATTEREHHARLINRPSMAKVNVLLDSVASSTGVEVRMPFWDRRLVEFCLSLPADQKIRHGYSRSILRRAMKGILPVAVRERGGKTGLNVSFDRGLRHFEQTRIQTIEATNESLSYLDREIFREFAGSYLDSSLSSEQELGFWRAFSLTLWLQNRPEIPPFSSKFSVSSQSSTPLSSTYAIGGGTTRTQSKFQPSQL